MNPMYAPLTDKVMDFNPYEKRTEDDTSAPYGGLVSTSNNRDVFRYAKGAAAQTRAKLKLAPSHVANHNNRTIDASSPAIQLAVGSTRITVDNGGTAAVAGEYDQGLVIFNDAAGEGQTIGISHNFVAGSSADIVVDLFSGLTVALTAGTSEVTLVHNTYNGCQELASKTLDAAGVSLIDTGAGDFYFVKTKGVVSCLIGTAATLGAWLTSDGSTAGAVTDATDVTAPQAEVFIGQASIVAGVSTENNPIVLKID